MTASTKNTIWALGIVGVLVFLAIKLWPALSRKLGASGSSGSTDGSSTSSPYYPSYPMNESASQGNLLSQLLNALTGNPSSAKASGQIGTGGAMPSQIGPGSYGSTQGDGGQAWADSIIDGINASDSLADQSQLAVDTAQESFEQIPDEQTALFDVNQMATPMDPEDYSPLQTTSVDIGESIDDSGDDSGS